MKNQYNISTSPGYLPDLATYIIAQFRDEIETDTGFNFKCWGDEFPAKMTVDRLIEVLHEAITESVDTKLEDIRRMDLGKSTIELTAKSADLGDRVVLKVFLSLNEDQEDYYDESDTVVGEAVIATLEAAGEAESLDSFVKNFKRLLKSVHDESRTSMIRWIFDSGNGHRDRTFQITKEWDIDRVYYPWIDTDLKSYYQAFLDSKAQILVTFGPPGTGKTSFIRDLICEMNLNAFISYDMKVLTSDSTFVRYLTDSIFDAIIIEDADELLTSARGDSNKIIAKILNISDGLIKLPRKKLIFSTNLSKVSDIDSAIIRPGRCFDVMEFRTLDKPEAEAVCVKLGIDLPVKNEGQKYTLAELFHDKNMKTSTDPFITHHADKIKKNTMGFV
jgi:SpoVK/Ycf46/Vps4 family AAA+-type ATPase